MSVLHLVWLGRWLDVVAVRLNTNHKPSQLALFFSFLFFSPLLFHPYLPPTSQLYLLVRSRRWSSASRAGSHRRSQICCHESMTAVSCQAGVAHPGTSKPITGPAFPRPDLAGSVHQYEVSGAEGDIKFSFSQSWNRNLIKELLFLLSRAAADLRSPFFDGQSRGQ